MALEEARLRLVVASLERGGSAELFHRLVEPRDHVWTISLENGSVFEVALSPERDRMTFLEIDLSGWSGPADEAPPTRRWVR